MQECSLGFKKIIILGYMLSLEIILGDLCKQALHKTIRMGQSHKIDGSLQPVRAPAE